MTDPTTPTDPTMPADNYPSGGTHPTNAVLWTDDGTVSKPLPKRYFTLTNNTDHTVYPFLIAANSNVQFGSKPPTPKYDPKDPLNQDYRGYIGYSLNGTNYLGLPAQQSVTIAIPLVFWDSGRMYIASNSANLIPDAINGQPNPPINPYQYYVESGGSKVLRWCQSIEGTTLEPIGYQAVVMWYHALIACGPLNDSPGQFIEFAIRDPWLQLVNPKIDDGDIGPLINYDVSYVDIIYLPVAMEAIDVPIPNSSKVAPYGWIGASQSEAQFQSAFQNFTASDPTQNQLGQYFGGRGYTQYYFPDDIKPSSGIKLPSGAQAIGDSPFSGHPSSYDIYMNMLESIDSDQLYDFKVGVNASMTVGQTYPAPVVTITLNGDTDTPSREEQLNTLAATVGKTPVWIKCLDSTCSSIFPEGTQLIEYEVSSGNNRLLTATLNQPVNFPAGTTSCSINLVPQPTDYVSSPMVNLWYAWAQYYVDNNPVTSQTYGGSITVPTADPKLSRVLTFDTPIPVHPDAKPALIPGMLVTGPGLPTYSASEGAFCTIADLIFNLENGVKTAIVAVKLSQYLAASEAGTYTFDPPPPIRWADAEVDGQPVVQKVQLTFSENADIALAFAQSVYQALSALSTIPPNATQQNPFPMQLLYAVIGCLVGYIPNIGNDKQVGEISGEITVKIKSVLRGVPDFTDTINWPESKWYPEPSIPTPGCQWNGKNCLFNVYNVDPYVWFIHKQLGLSGYGFSVDDDVSDVGANSATHLQISIGGLGGMSNPAQWSAGVPYGPVSGSGEIEIVSNPDGSKTYKITNLPHTSDNPVYWMITSPNTGAGQQGALVKGQYIQPGTRVVATDNPDYSVILDTPFTSDAKSGDISTYEFC